MTHAITHLGRYVYGAFNRQTGRPYPGIQPSMVDVLAIYPLYKPVRISAHQFDEVRIRNIPVMPQPDPEFTFGRKPLTGGGIRQVGRWERLDDHGLAKLGVKAEVDNAHMAGRQDSVNKPPIGYQLCRPPSTKLWGLRRTLINPSWWCYGLAHRVTYNRRRGVTARPSLTCTMA